MAGKKKGSLPDFSSWVRGLLKANEEDCASKLFNPDLGLYVVATPIGNLGDISLRALWVLQMADLILCEDTRVAGSLLHQYGIKKPLLSCHDHNETDRIATVLQRLAHGERLALISDAGTPMISDPGYKLVRACREAGHNVVALPGASAVLTALACAGMASDRFTFIGFLPNKPSARRKELEELSSLSQTLVFYESPQRLAATLKDMAEILSGTREAVVGRELTKLYEEMRFGTLEDLAETYAREETPKGEVVLLVSPQTMAAPALSEASLDALLLKALQTMSLKDAVAAVVEATGLKKNIVYQRALALS